MQFLICPSLLPFQSWYLSLVTEVLSWSSSNIILTALTDVFFQRRWKIQLPGDDLSSLNYLVHFFIPECHSPTLLHLHSYELKEWGIFLNDCFISIFLPVCFSVPWRPLCALSPAFLIFWIPVDTEFFLRWVKEYKPQLLQHARLIFACLVCLNWEKCDKFYC